MPEPETSALRYRDFRLFWTGALVSNIGSWMQSLAVPVVLYAETGSAAWVGLAAFMQFFPTVPLGPLGGSIADRFDRRTVLLVTQTLLTLTALLLWGLWVAGVHEPWAIVAVVGLSGCIAGVNIPSWQSFLPELVPRDALLSAITLNSAQFNAARAVGPALGGAVLALLGPGWAFLFNALSFLAVIGALVAVRVPRRPRVHTTQRVLSQFAEACRYLWARPGMRTAVLLVIAMAFLGNPMLQLAVPVAREVYGAGAAGIGLLTAAFGAGAVAGAVLLGRLGGRFARSTLGRATFAAFAVSVVAFAAATSLAAGMAAFALAGAAYLMAIATLNTTVQLDVDERYRGRVMGIYVMGFTAAYPLGALVQGAVADVAGARLTIAVAGLVLCGLAVVLLVRPGIAHTLDGAAAPA